MLRAAWGGVRAGDYYIWHGGVLCTKCASWGTRRWRSRRMADRMELWQIVRRSIALLLAVRVRLATAHSS